MVVLGQPWFQQQLQTIPSSVRHLATQVTPTLVHNRMTELVA
jgi:hypothetical protein